MSFFREKKASHHPMHASRTCGAHEVLTTCLGTPRSSPLVLGYLEGGPALVLLEPRTYISRIGEQFPTTFSLRLWLGAERRDGVLLPIVPRGRGSGMLLITFHMMVQYLTEGSRAPLVRLMQMSLLEMQMTFLSRALGNC